MNARFTPSGAVTWLASLAKAGLMPKLGAASATLGGFTITGGGGPGSTINTSAATASLAGAMLAADKALLDTATSAATANALAGRNGSGIALFNHETPTAVTYQNSFADSGTYGGVKYWKSIEGLVHFEGSAKRALGAPAGGTVIFNLPAGYRPLALTNAYVETDTTRCQLNILTNGDVQWFSGGTGFINIADITPFRTS